MHKKSDYRATRGSLTVDDPVLRRDKAAAYIGVSTPHYDRLIREPGGPRYFKAGRAVCSRRSWLNEYIDRKIAQQAE